MRGKWRKSNANALNDKWYEYMRSKSPPLLARKFNLNLALTPEAQIEGAPTPDAGGVFALGGGEVREAGRDGGSGGGGMAVGTEGGGVVEATHANPTDGGGVRDADDNASNGDVSEDDGETDLVELGQEEQEEEDKDGDEDEGKDKEPTLVKAPAGGRRGWKPPRMVPAVKAATGVTAKQSLPARSSARTRLGVVGGKS
ncbi:hypothetical protein HXX76_011383 [Chlamydomonas incerta]|uniref:Uncharacterized protein n=1 Tax=Chlamydomonas incerta TaxID=51695 RepID=A0A835SKA3_CHLIN|nr:hypothetical protein HXX76_011383 [Chlamydomonas incerta]|eukprot:KAG2428678.1 hypothetical protein HXX76_011383 [Chlamydomonas incerta]